MIVILAGLNNPARSQFLDTLMASLKQPHQLFFTVDFSKSFGANNGTDIIGFRLGTAQNHRIYYGLGYYILNTDVINDITVSNEMGVDTILPAQLKLRFFTVNGEYFFYRDVHWQFGLPINIGYGKSYYQYFKSRGEKTKTSKSGSMILTFGLSGQYKFIPWVGLGFGISHAGTLGSNKYNDRDFKAWIYNFGIKIYFDEIYHTLRDLKSQAAKNKKPVNLDDGPQPDYKN